MNTTPTEGYLKGGPILYPPKSNGCTTQESIGIPIQHHEVSKVSIKITINHHKHGIGTGILMVNGILMVYTI